MRVKVSIIALAIFLHAAVLANASQPPARLARASGDAAPTLKLVATVANDMGGAGAPDDWTLSATAAAPNDARNFSSRGGSGALHAVYAGVAYLLTEAGPADYIAGAWSCTGGSLAGSTLTLGKADTSVVCIIANVQPTAKITPTGTACLDFKNGTAKDLTRALYAVKRGAIASVAPGVLLYYSKLAAMPASFTIQVRETQSPHLSWPWLPPETIGQVVLYDANCNKSRAQTATAYDPLTGVATIRASGAAGATYYLGIKVNPAALKRAGVNAPYPKITYRIETWVDGSAVISSQAAVDLTFKK